MAINDAVAAPTAEDGKGRSGSDVHTISFDDFLARFGEDDHVEWVGGKVIRRSPATDRHQDLLRFLVSLLNLHVEAHELGWLSERSFRDVARGPGSRP